MYAFKGMLRANLILLFVFAACLVVGDDYNAPAFDYEHYISANQRQYRDNIDYCDAQIAEFRLMYQQQLGVLEQLSSQIEMKLKYSSHQLESAEAFSKSASACVEKYRKQLPGKDDITHLKNCIAEGRSSQYKFTTPLTKRVRTLDKYYTTTVVNSLAKCQKNISAPDSTHCITAVIENATTTTVQNRQAFDVGLKQAKLASEIRINEVVKCSLNYIYDIVSRMNTTINFVKDCLDVENVLLKLL